ncbi:MAG: GNAT family N-acetyltransferase [Bacteroidia bacterium]|nr:GNAT family N-acetyltransferase [Bacteroidia bacterium]
MIKYLQHHEIDKERWDDCIRRSFNGIIYAYSWYLDVVHPGWEALVNADYSTVMPLTGGKKLGVRYLYNPFFVQQLGVFSVARLSPDAVREYLNAVPAHFRYCEINLNTFNHPTADSYRFKENLNHELDMIGSYEMIRKEYSDNAKRNIKKAQLHDLSVVSSTSKEEIIALFRNDRGKDIEVLKETEYDTLRRLLQALDGRGRLHTRGVHNAAGQLIAGAFFCDANGKVVFLFSGNSAEGKEKGAMFLLVDNFIQENAQKNLILDFEGSNDPQLARFYKGFGAKECVYLQAKRNTLPWYLRWYKD